MSGGSYDYLYSKVEDAADRLRGQNNPLRRAFGVHLKAIAKALHDIEWVDSCDTSPGDEVPAIKKALGGRLPQLLLNELSYEMDRLERWLAEIRVAVNELENGA